MACGTDNRSQAWEVMFTSSSSQNTLLLDQLYRRPPLAPMGQTPPPHRARFPPFKALLFLFITVAGTVTRIGRSSPLSSV